jgi:hypothetical protein
MPRKARAWVERSDMRRRAKAEAERSLSRGIRGSDQLSRRLLGLEHARHVEDHDVAMRSKAGLGSQLARTDLEPQYRRAIATVSNTALTHIGRTFGEGSDEGEDSGSCLPHASGRAAPFEIEDVRVRVVGLGVGQRESLVALTPCFDMRSEMDLGLLGHPNGLAERRHQLAGARDELTGLTRRRDHGRHRPNVSA